MPDDVRLSKLLSKWLRHDPASAGLVLDAQGWTGVDDLLAALTRAQAGCDWERLLRIVEASDKQRFELSGDAARIRARQGHSVAVELDWPEREPPAILYHGTVERFIAAIMAEGLRPMARHHVHLSPDEETAQRVGARRGKPVILRVQAGRMFAEGRRFQLTSNGVWLTEHVPPEYIAR